MCQPKLNYEIVYKTVTCGECKGSGEAQLNDFSDPYQVTTYAGNCMTCGGYRKVKLIESITVKCLDCHQLTEEKDYPFTLDEDQKKHVQLYGYIHGQCAECEIAQTMQQAGEPS